MWGTATPTLHRLLTTPECLACKKLPCTHGILPSAPASMACRTLQAKWQANGNICFIFSRVSRYQQQRMEPDILGSFQRPMGDSQGHIPGTQGRSKHRVPMAPGGTEVKATPAQTGQRSQPPVVYLLPNSSNLLSRPRGQQQVFISRRRAPPAPRQDPQTVARQSPGHLQATCCRLSSDLL